MSQQVNPPRPKSESSTKSNPENDNIMLDYPIVSIAYCVRCKWMLRAAWYQQEILQTFASKEDPEATEKAGDGFSKLTINSVLLKPSLVAGTFTIAIKPRRADNWTVLWDRKMNGGFPDSKVVKQKIRDIVKPGLKMRHLDRPSESSNGCLISGGGESCSNRSLPPTQGSANSKSSQGSSLARTKTFTEECLECTRTWEG
ncbi:hypothetical protein HII13_004869 [Brettanomyces bruxellensis]|uniref:DEBR0S2_07668g1_1 n=1 Tax=Dekkera bruxellensis TaxID=5007 RepID=A0A7D9CWG7_DEKBR|nr:uncharacterized protein BRETT_001666 [Brettanomyces bruxellensis]KAF6006788.1 hypothetical protein HII13_004869 [Brettanomyces bruxellensis]KAF6014534.1 hypothetical protein HII12_001358 [Brettanomyces bruxellensis]QOU18600.1 hypothetical protein BRETT_001666 [Brettanomyces bruxellensis]VUG17458.1 DEBR0S2_07668g1_1 [Brettanomyces bruxellensis]